MTARELTLVALAVLALAAVALSALGRARRLGLVPLGEVLTAATSSRSGRLAVAAAWAWVGWHFLAR